MDDTYGAERPAGDRQLPVTQLGGQRRDHPPYQEDDREGVSVAEASRITGLSRWTIYQLIRDGTLASVKVGKRRIVMRRSCSDLLRRGA